MDRAEPQTRRVSCGSSYRSLGDRCLQIEGAKLIRQLVLGNQAMIGSVNAARGHFQMGANDLEQARLRWGSHLEALITQHYTPEEFVSSADRADAGAIKQVVEWPPK